MDLARLGSALKSEHARRPRVTATAGEIDPSFVITHRTRIEDAPYGYEIFPNKQDDCRKVVLTP
jgi:threonine dehydrogenase-like Zn-dependent dehydrogenase